MGAIDWTKRLSIVFRICPRRGGCWGRDRRRTLHVTLHDAAAGSGALQRSEIDVPFPRHPSRKWGSLYAVAAVAGRRERRVRCRRRLRCDVHDVGLGDRSCRWSAVGDGTDVGIGGGDDRHQLPDFDGRALTCDNLAEHPVATGL